MLMSHTYEIFTGNVQRMELVKQCQIVLEATEVEQSANSTDSIIRHAVRKGVKCTLLCGLARICMLVMMLLLMSGIQPNPGPGPGRKVL